jgi:uncharacterized protein involved in tolerance to divalent cations
MPTIEITIKDDNGNILNTDSEFKYDFDTGSERFSEIEGAVEEFRLRSLPEITKFMLDKKQAKFEKKTT